MQFKIFLGFHWHVTRLSAFKDTYCHSAGLTTMLVVVKPHGRHSPSLDTVHVGAEQGQFGLRTDLDGRLQGGYHRVIRGHEDRIDTPHKTLRRLINIA